MKKKTLKETKKTIETYDIVEMIKAVVSSCIQRGVDSVSKEEIKEFYEQKNFEECFKEAISHYLSSTTYRGIAESTTYYFDLKRKRLNGRVARGYNMQTAIRKAE